MCTEGGSVHTYDETGTCFDCGHYEKCPPEDAEFQARVAWRNRTSTTRVQELRARNKAKGYLRRDVYATDAEFRAIKALLTKMREGK